MTPTLMGRWQTRIAMLGTFGVLISLVFALTWPAGTDFTEEFFYVLGYVALFGLAWDVLWIIIQSFRWDRDWPPAFQWVTAGIEGLAVYLLIDNFAIPGIPEGAVPKDIFAAHYGLVFFVTWAWTQGPMRAMYPRWRFTGGRIL